MKRSKALIKRSETVRNGERQEHLGTIELERSNAMERIVENGHVHVSKTKESLYVISVIFACHERFPLYVPKRYCFPNLPTFRTVCKSVSSKKFHFVTLLKRHQNHIKNLNSIFNDIVMRMRTETGFVMSVEF